MSYRKASKNDLEEFKFIVLYCNYPPKTQFLFQRILSHIRWQGQKIKKLKEVK